MNFDKFLTQKIDWNSLPQQELRGSSGRSVYREVFTGDYRLRLAEYSADYKSEDWCDKGHIIHCVNGKVTLHFKSKSDILIEAGNTIILGGKDAHMASTENSPATLFIIDKN